MGLGAWLAAVTDEKEFVVNEKREKRSIRAKPAAGEEEIYEVFTEYNIPRTSLMPLADSPRPELRPVDKGEQPLFSRRLKMLTSQFMMDFKLKMEKPDPSKAWISAGVMGASYFLGGIIPPMIPYFVTKRRLHPRSRSQSPSPSSSSSPSATSSRSSRVRATRAPSSAPSRPSSSAHARRWRQLRHRARRERGPGGASRRWGYRADGSSADGSRTHAMRTGFSLLRVLGFEIHRAPLTKAPRKSLTEGPGFFSAASLPVEHNDHRSERLAWLISSCLKMVVLDV